MGTSTGEEQFNAFMEKVKRTIYVDNLAPHVKDSVIKAAFNQFGNVKSVQFIFNYFEPKDCPKAALVEMDNPKQAHEIVTQMRTFPLMISGMPRPVRAFHARLEMFDDRPMDPRRTIHYYWLDPQDHDYKVAKEIKACVRKHAVQASLLLQKQREEEAELEREQNETLDSHYKKLELLETVFEDGTLKRLEKRYKVNN